jgi:hypothetical protein
VRGQGSARAVAPRGWMDGFAFCLYIKDISTVLRKVSSSVFIKFFPLSCV